MRGVTTTRDIAVMADAHPRGNRSVRAFPDNAMRQEVPLTYAMTVAAPDDEPPMMHGSATLRARCPKPTVIGPLSINLRPKPSALLFGELWPIISSGHPIGRSRDRMCHVESPKEIVGSLITGKCPIIAQKSPYPGCKLLTRLTIHPLLDSVRRGYSRKSARKPEPEPDFSKLT